MHKKNKLNSNKYTKTKIFTSISCLVFVNPVFAISDTVVNDTSRNFAVNIYNDTQHPVYSFYTPLVNGGISEAGYTINPIENRWDWYKQEHRTSKILSYVIPLGDRNLVLIPNVTSGDWDIYGRYYLAEVSNDYWLKAHRIWDFIQVVRSDLNIGTKYENFLDRNWHGCLGFKQIGNDLKIYQSGRGNCQDISYDSYDLVKTIPNAYAANNFWPDANICNKSGEKINVNISDTKNLKSLEVPGSWGSFTKYDFDLLPESCGEIIHHRTNLSDLSQYKITIKDSAGNEKISQTYADRPKYQIFDNTSHKLSFGNQSNFDGWETLFKPNNMVKINQNSCMGFDFIKCQSKDKQNDELVNTFSDWSPMGELQYSLRMPDSISSQIESDVLNLYVAPLGNNFKHEVGKKFSNLIYDSFNKVSLSSKKLNEIDGKNFNINDYPNLKLCKAYAPSYTLNETTPMGSKMTDVEVIPLGNIYSSNETLVNNLDYVQTLNTMTFSWAYTDSTTHTLMHAWNASLKLSVNTKFKVDMPVGGSETTIGYEVNVGYNGSDTNSHTVTDTTTVTFPSQAIIVNPKTTVLYRGTAKKAKINGNLKVEFPFSNLKEYGLFARDGNCSNTSYKNLKDLEIDSIKLLSDPKAKTDPVITLDKDKQLVYATDVLKLALEASYDTHLEVSEAVKNSTNLKSEQVIDNLKFHDVRNSQKNLQNGLAPKPNATPFWIKLKNWLK